MIKQYCIDNYKINVILCNLWDETFRPDFFIQRIKKEDTK